MSNEDKQKEKPKDNAGSGFGGQPPRLEIPTHPDDRRAR